MLLSSSMRHHERRSAHSNSKGVIFSLETPFGLRFQRSEGEMTANLQGTGAVLTYGGCAGAGVAVGGYGGQG
ncbi:hypothetical protein V6Z11_A07G108700 [Gossypium hirsutum]